MGIQLPPVVTDVLRAVAPTLLAGISLTGPIGAAVAGVASLALKAWLPTEKQIDLTVNGAQATQPEVVRVIQENASNPSFLRDLKRAELDAQQMEAEFGLKFAELEQKDRSDARAFARDTGTARTAYGLGWAVLAEDALVTIGCLVGSFLLLSGSVVIRDQNLVLAVFTLMGGMIGRISARADTFFNFVYGSSKSSSEKSEQIGQAMSQLGVALGDAAKAAPVIPPAPIVVTPAPLPAPPDEGEGGSTAPQPLPPQPAVPAPSGLVAQLLPQLTTPHKHFDDGVWWALTPAGITVEGAPPQSTPGEPATCRAVWKRYGDLFSAAARQYGVPVELLIATALTESRGDPNARRAEPKINDASTGLMQTLRATARQALGRRDITDDDLLDPATSINAGAAYIAQQRASTHFDPPLVAAAYNAGSIRRDSGSANRWKILVYPTGTGRHLDSYIAWFGDCMRVSAEQGWGTQEGVPSFASCLAAGAPHEQPSA
jgi:hypothetical protein